MDPIRPFANLIRSLRAGRSGKARPSEAPAGSSASDKDVSSIAAAAATLPLEHALRARLPSSGNWDSRRAREAFVEHALSREFGADISGDAAFGELVARVSTLIEQHADINQRLDVLLRSIAESERSR